MKGLAAWLAARRCSPNLISLAGMVAGVGAGVLLWRTGEGVEELTKRGCYLGAAALIQFRLLCNLIDGMVAVEGGMKSVVGDLYNDVPDRVSDAGTLIGAGLAISSSPTLGYIAAIVAVMTAYIRAVGKSLTGVADYRGPMAKQHRMAILTVTAVFCALAPISIQIAWYNALPFGIPATALLIIIFGGLITAVRRLYRIAANLRKRIA